ncbi:MAG: FAD-dependent oxidoreductase [Tetragenococcus koreensis]|nr:FAD-dependent oxidoreductase [Tetragenococcus koreensis]MDN6142014.1 FAD-dependent oxidoreductase [Tetragenococcus halophilus]MDN6541898.1 FAD-dependent oxidoreductase [Tetragenococcus koreensis]MDN6568519.1 FAD-dependent oxidoreductase [Tetragenococcus halophilus]MDN6607339.1 FAD-dependent oxidoreductase [Tetragenococcus halophilus]
MKVIVLGSSHGGYEAVQALLSTYSQVKIQWYEKEVIDPLVIEKSTKSSGKDMNDTPSIYGLTFDELKQRGVDIFENTEIIRIQPVSHIVKIKDHISGKVWEESYDKLILSPGSYPSVQTIPGNDLKNIGTMSDRKDIIKVKKKAEDAAVKDVVIVGTGYIGIGAAQVFFEAGKNVTVIDINNRPLSSYLDKELTDVIEKELTKRQIVQAMPDKVIKFLGDEYGNVKKVVTKKGVYPADLVIMSIGNSPNTAWLEDAVELLPNGRIKTDEYMRTSAIDIFAIGDATTVPYGPNKIPMNLSLATNARRQAHYAVKNLKEAKHPFPSMQGSSAMQAFGYKFATVGLTEKLAKRMSIDIKSAYWEQNKLMDSTFSTENQTRVMFKLIYDPRTLEILGGQIMSKDDLTANINAISLAIQMRSTIEQLAYADFFFQPGFSTPWNVMNMAALKALGQENKFF